MKIAVIGPVFADIKGYPDTEFIKDGRNSGRIEYVHGGVSRNIAEDLAIAGQQPVFLSLVDESGLGAEIVNHLNQLGVDTSCMQAVKDGMGTWMAIFDNQGDVVANLSKRPNIMPLLDILSENEAVFDLCKTISLEIDTHEEIVAKTFKMAEKYGCDVYAVISNMGIAKERKPYFSKLRCLVCNIQEMGMLFGDGLRFEYENDNNSEIKTKAERLAKALLERIQLENIRSMYVTLGAAGAVYADSALGCYGYIPAEKVNVVDTTGAGDAFFSGIVASLSNGKSYDEAGRFASKMSASVIQSTANVCGKI